MRIESIHKTAYGYHTLEKITLPNGNKTTCLVWHDTKKTTFLHF